MKAGYADISAGSLGRLPSESPAEGTRGQMAENRQSVWQHEIAAHAHADPLPPALLPDCPLDVAGALPAE